MHIVDTFALFILDVARLLFRTIKIYDSFCNINKGYKLCIKYHGDTMQLAELSSILCLVEAFG